MCRLYSPMAEKGLRYQIRCFKKPRKYVHLISTYLSEAHNSVSWLDNLITTNGGHDIVQNVSVALVL